PGVTSHGVVTTLVAEIPQVLEYPDQRQPFAGGFGLVDQQHSIEMIPPGAELRLRLAGALVFELRLIAAQNLAHHFARYPQLAADRLDRLALHPGKSAYLQNCLHNKRPNKKPPMKPEAVVTPSSEGVPFGSRSPRQRGPYSMLNHIPALQRIGRGAAIPSAEHALRAHQRRHHHQPQLQRVG